MLVNSNLRNLNSSKNKLLCAKPYQLQLTFGLNLLLAKQNKTKKKQEKQDKAILGPMNNSDKLMFCVELLQWENTINYISKEKQ